ncbi:MAG: 2Fe-2S iron-sulfur cluster-binding protein [Gemmatimonas sp.]
MTAQPRDPAPYYETHVFCCMNQREPGHPRSCCADRGGVELREYMKSRAKELGLKKLRVNQSGCLERCELGAALVIYPEGIWYTYSTKDDVDEILDRHIMKGEIVERLVLENEQKVPKPTAKKQLALTVAKVVDETADIKRFELVSADGKPLPEFTAGAHIDVLMDNGQRRSYSLANNPTERNRYVIGVLREPASRGGSAWMHDAVKAGMTLKATAPLNNFKLAEDAKEHILIAGGIGITPILAMGHRLKALGANATLHYCTRSPEKTSFKAEVQEAFGGKVVFHHDGGDPSKGIKLADVLKTRHEGAHLYICGPSGLLEAARKASAHWPDETVHFEHFAATPMKKPATANEPFEVYLSRRKLTLTVPADKSILEVVRAAGVEADSSCETGICSTCETRLISGRADHRDEVLSEADRIANKKILICTSRAMPGEKLVLDL